jgi:hypothetical protein
VNVRGKPWLRVAGRVSLFVVLLLAPTLARAAYYYRRPYVAPGVQLPDLAQIQVTRAPSAPLVDEDVQTGSGIVAVDRAHGNRVDDAELNVLLARLAKRGMRATSVWPEDSLPDALRTAAALVVVSPHVSYSDNEIAAVARFVEQGGRILLAADPSRYNVEVRYDEAGSESYLVQSDVPAINSLASAFGLAFADDYLYNTQENAGNYQYVILRDLADGPLSAGVTEVVFYAAHSVSASEEVVIRSSPATASSLHEQGGGWVTMALGGGGQVLAVGDFTFMTEPHNASLDNDRLIANIADFIATAERTFGLTEFPHFLGSEIDLVPVFSGTEETAFSGATVSEVSKLQSALSSADVQLHWHSEPEASHDRLYLGLYDGLNRVPEAAGILAQHGITLTLETAERAQLALTPQPTLQAPQPETTPTPTATLRPARDWIHVPGIGQIEAQQNVLFYANEEQGRQVLLILAYTEEGLGTAIDRLLSGDWTGCLIDDDRLADPLRASMAVCPAEYTPPEAPVATPMPDEEMGETTGPYPAPDVSVLIVGDDDGKGVYEGWSSAYLLYDAVTSLGYEPQAWSTTYDGPITETQLAGRDVVLWCTGDYQDEGGNPSAEELSLLEDYLQGGGHLLLVGAFLGDPEGRSQGLLVDIQVSDPENPLTQSFGPDEVIDLVRFGADEDYAPYDLLRLDGGTVAWIRGPGSELAGEAVIATSQYGADGGRLAVAGVPLYLLPYEDGLQLGSDIVLWLLEGG